MEHKTFYVQALIYLFFLQLLLQHALASASNTNTKTSPLEFFKQFQGTQKGDRVKGINALKKYLHTLGYYLNHQNNYHVADTTAAADTFDENLETAIKTYQINFNLDPTGTLDLKTISTMAKPRCGNPDIINGTTRMHSKNYNNNSSSSSTIFHSHYALYPGNPKWPATIKIITYAFLPRTRDDFKEPVRQALESWSKYTPFTFQLVMNYNHADIKISFQRGDHGDGYPFDGPGKIIAHSFRPTDGRSHFDADEKWAVGAVPESYDMQTLALHELGHVLGLDHTSDEAAIMYPLLPLGGTKGLNDDDITGMKTLYGT